MMETDANTKNYEDGCPNATTHKIHLPAVGTGGLYVIDSHRNKRETGSIDNDVDDGTNIIMSSTESESHLHSILYRQSYHGGNNHPA